MNTETRLAALTFAQWAIVWSPVATKEARVEAWRILELPEPFSEYEPDYWPAFHIGSPLPAVPLLLHAALGMEGGRTREEWMRIFQFLDLRWKEATLSPDHLAPVCEALAAAIERRDDVLMTEIFQRYLVPWCEHAKGRLEAENAGMCTVVRQFESDVLEVESQMVSCG